MFVGNLQQKQQTLEKGNVRLPPVSQFSTGKQCTAFRYRIEIYTVEGVGSNSLVIFQVKQKQQILEKGNVCQPYLLCLKSGEGGGSQIFLTFENIYKKKTLEKEIFWVTVRTPNSIFVLER